MHTYLEPVDAAPHGAPLNFYTIHVKPPPVYLGGSTPLGKRAQQPPLPEGRRLPTDIDKGALLVDVVLAWNFPAVYHQTWGVPP